MLVLFGVTEAAAHSAPPSGVLPVLVDGALWGGGTSWGVVGQASDGAFVGTCDELFGDALRFYADVATSAGPRLLVGTSTGVLATEDGGCTAAPVPGLVGHNAMAVAQADTAIFVVTASAARENGLHLSTDGGRSFAPRGPQRDDLILTSLAVDGRGENVWMAGLMRDPVRPVLLVSHDGGETFVDHADRFPAAVQLRVLAADEAREGGVGVVLVMVDGYRRNHLFHADATLEARARVAEVIGEVGAWARFAGRELITVNNNDLRLVAGGVTTSVPGGPTHCLLTIPGDERLWGCGQIRHGAFFLSSTDGLSWQPHLPIANPLPQRDCPEDSAAVAVCAPDAPPGGGDPAPSPDERDKAPPPDEGDPASPEDSVASSGCASGAHGGGWTLVAVLAFTARRRTRCGGLPRLGVDGALQERH